MGTLDLDVITHMLLYTTKPTKTPVVHSLDGLALNNVVTLL